MKIFYLPDLGEGLAEAEVREWYVKVGDIVKVDQPLLSVETAKAVVDVPSPFAGKVTQLYGKVQEVIQTHAPLVEFDGTSEEQTLNHQAGDTDKGSIVGQLEESQHALDETVTIGTPVSEITLKVSSLVKALAKQMRVDLNQVIPTGAKGEITAGDVKRHATQSVAHRTLVQGEALHGVRRAMALAMSQAHQEVAQITLMDDVDIGHLNTDADMTVLLLQAMVAGIQAEPGMNAWFDGKILQRQLIKDIHVGLAMDTPEGLFVPVIKNVDQENAAGLRDKINYFKQHVKNRTVTPSDMQGATIALSNFGSIAGKYASPLVVPPIIAILGSGRIHEAAVVREGKIIISRLLPLSLSADHRAITGGEAVRFLAAVKSFLQSS